MTVTVSDSYIQPLIDKANELYDKQVHKAVWIDEFRLRDLAILWEFTCVISADKPFSASYDDEVYDSLSELGYFGDKNGIK